jgi:diguanylate cyclase (GGDEF)-like protein
VKEDIVGQIRIEELQKKHGVRFLAVLTNRVALWLGQKLYERGFLSEITEKDALTGLYNRNFFERWSKVIMAQAERVGAKLSLVFVDVDGLKIANDRDGHQAGDRLLRRVGKSLAKHVRQSDLVVRLGGDEFVAILWNCDVEGACRMMEKQVKRMKKKEIGFSYGVSMWEKGKSLEKMMAEADSLMYEMKKKKK